MPAGKPRPFTRHVQSSLGNARPCDLPRICKAFKKVLPVLFHEPLTASRSKLGHDLIAIGDQDRLAGLDQPDVFGEPRLELLDPDDLHSFKLVTGGHLVNRPGA